MLVLLKMNEKHRCCLDSLQTKTPTLRLLAEHDTGMLVFVMVTEAVTVPLLEEYRDLSKPSTEGGVIGATQHGDINSETNVAIHLRRVLLLSKEHEVLMVLLLKKRQTQMLPLHAERQRHRCCY